MMSSTLWMALPYLLLLALSLYLLAKGIGAILGTEDKRNMLISVEGSPPTTYRKSMEAELRKRDKVAQVMISASIVLIALASTLLFSAIDGARQEDRDRNDRAHQLLVEQRLTEIRDALRE